MARQPDKTGKNVAKSRAKPVTTAKTRAKPEPEAKAPEVEVAKPAPTTPTVQKLAENIERIETLGHRLMSALADRSPPNRGVEGPGAELYLTAANAFLKTLAEHPAKMIETQVTFWGQTLSNYARAQKAMATGQLTAPEDDSPADRRFANPLWQTHPYFNLIKKQYLTNARALKDATATLDLPDDVSRKRVH